MSVIEAGVAGGRRLIQAKKFIEAEGVGQAEELLQHKVINFEPPVQVKLQNGETLNCHLSLP